MLLRDQGRYLARDTPASLAAVGQLFDRRDLLCDWGSVDSISSALRQLVVLDPARACPIFERWGAESGHTWKQRAACVTFCCVVKKPHPVMPLAPVVLRICANTVRNPERFAQLGTGWVLRDTAVRHHDEVLAFLDTHASQYMSREGLRYAIEQFDATQRTALLDKYKTTCASGQLVTRTSARVGHKRAAAPDTKTAPPKQRKVT